MCMKIHHLYESNEQPVPESEIQFGGLHYYYRRFNVEDDAFNFIHFSNSSGIVNVHLSNYVSTPASIEEIVEPDLDYDDVEQLHDVVLESLYMTEALIPKSLREKQDVKCLYMLRTNELEKLERHMESFKTDIADFEYAEQTKFSGHTFCKYVVTFPQQKHTI